MYENPSTDKDGVVFSESLGLTELCTNTGLAIGWCIVVFGEKRQKYLLLMDYNTRYLHYHVGNEQKVTVCPA